MTRTENLCRLFTKDMRLIEVGASYNPLIPKSAGWQTTVVDHASREVLAEKYKGVPGAQPIEEVDYIWQDGPVSDAIPASLHGTFDGFIASHVGEHMPDLIGFFTAVARLLKPTGIFVLALPDKRLCFDFFKSVSMTGDLIDAMGKTRHTVGTNFDNAAYYTQRGDVIAWAGDSTTPFSLNDFGSAHAAIKTDMTQDYIDLHHWYFTPASFQLLILELNLLGLIPWSIVSLEPAPAVEFYVWLEPRKLVMTPEQITARRLELLREMVMEAKVQVAQLEAPPASVAGASPVTISTVIPLYNGGRFIEEALRSVLNQTVQPIEIIVVDDGSTDNGPDLVRAMAEQHPITLLSKYNGGQSSARNMGIAHSTGTHIALLDQDDIWYPTHLEELRRPFMRVNSGQLLGWVYSNLDEIDTAGQMVERSFLHRLHHTHPKRSLLTCLQEDMMILPSASLIRRTAFDAVGGFDERLSGYEDDDLFLRLFRAGYGNEYIKKALSQWRIYMESSSYTNRMRRSRAIFARKLLELYPDDVGRARYYHRDLILPRFYPHAFAEYRLAVRSGDTDAINETYDHLTFLVSKMPKKKTLGRALRIVRSPPVALAVFSARRVLRPIVRQFRF